MIPNSSSEPQIRVLDLAEYPLVVSVDRQGRPEISSTSPCPAVQARMLRDLAAMIESTSHSCCGALPAPLVDAYAPLLEQSAPRLPVDDAPPAAMWTDGAGAVWNLDVAWRDRSGTDWRWTGIYDRVGVPMMQSDRSGCTYPLDTLAVFAGPLSPSRGRSC
ncbi:phiSA1p31-related protein [Streptomyces violaceusniger]|uniref:phiSA1p31-related protein n=1 Tax=Streptomyces violaceusniger TaxID=68280 RepID=UPI0009962645|nr:phiSA1p31-related protein [Streptomyces hygroscopicus]AQW55250.1 hypothetical protein SHXM_08713 [Streptomyces hygroscopicus]